ncbi:MAG: membrane dipeptidase [Chloroflexi bacterium]|nr:membrane dipeptidase [Chloroflexota bacterium]
MTLSMPSLHERAALLHNRSIVIDALDVSRFDEAHFRKMQAGGITAANVTVVMPSRNFRQAVEGIRDFDLLVERHADLVMPVRTVADIATAKAAGKVGLIYGFQNAVPIEGDLRLVKVFHSLGIRIIQLTYMTANFVGDGCLEPRNGGLTIFGRAVVRELNRTGILIDLSHVGERTTLDAVDAAESPVAITHACCLGLVDNPRNKTDEVIRALAARGGVMGITSHPNFVCDFDREEAPTLEQYLRQIDYVANLVGVDHVGIGMDYVDGHEPNFSGTPAWGGTQAQADRKVPGRAVWPMPYAVADSSKMLEVTEGLLARGYAEDDVQKVLGGNWVRLFGQVWGG